ncbi:MAG: hypothetical protein R3C05_24870 [Pirellulaceae bacterium]
MDVGWLSLLPFCLAIGLAVVTRRVIASLAVAVYVGVLIYELLNPRRSGLAADHDQCPLGR